MQVAALKKVKIKDIGPDITNIREEDTLLS